MILTEKINLSSTNKKFVYLIFIPKYCNFTKNNVPKYCNKGHEQGFCQQLNFEVRTSIIAHSNYCAALRMVPLIRYDVSNAPTSFNQSFEGPHEH